MKNVVILIPAHDEADFIGACLSALLESDTVRDAAVSVVVIANACQDATARIADRYQAQALAKGWALLVVETAIPGKLAALNLGEAQAGGDIRLYLDADVIVSPPLVGDLVQSLNVPEPRYASGSPDVVAPKNLLIRRYARFWSGLPFVARDVPGFGIFAVNSAGRARWDCFPNIISDDTFVRLQFLPTERIRVDASYRWPMVASIGNLIRVRRRQDKGVAEISERYPDLVQNDGGSRPGLGYLAKRLLRDPVGFAAYGLVSLVVRLPVLKSSTRWARGR